MFGCSFNLVEVNETFCSEVQKERKSILSQTGFWNVFSYSMSQMSVAIISAVWCTDTVSGCRKGINLKQNKIKQKPLLSLGSLAGVNVLVVQWLELESSVCPNSRLPALTICLQNCRCDHKCLVTFTQNPTNETFKPNFFDHSFSSLVYSFHIHFYLLKANWYWIDMNFFFAPPEAPATCNSPRQSFFILAFVGSACVFHSLADNFENSARRCLVLQQES